jgi:hypothetical protein
MSGFAANRRAEAENTRLSSLGSSEYIVVLVTFNFRYLASAPKVRWRARAGALGLEQGPSPRPRASHTTTSSRFWFQSCLVSDLIQPVSTFCFRFNTNPYN